MSSEREEKDRVKNTIRCVCVCVVEWVWVWEKLSTDIYIYKRELCSLVEAALKMSQSTPKDMSLTMAENNKKHAQ